MKTHQHTQSKYIFRLIISALVSFLVALVLPILSAPQVAQAEGSKDLVESGGDRPYLDYRDDTTKTIPTNNGIRRRTLIYVYVKAGERIHLGSSAVAGTGRIDAIAPNDGTTTTFDNSSACGDISNTTEETNGPVAITAGGYSSCQIVAAADEGGIWTIHFVSEDPSDDNNTPGSGGFVEYWDVTVSNAGNTTAYEGRAYANLLALNMTANSLSLESIVYIQTQDGALYEMDLNGIDPWAAVFFSNNKGFTEKATGKAIYRSLQFNTEGDNADLYGKIPADYTFHNPTDDDTATDITQKIFFNTPAADLPASANVWGGSATKPIWLKPTYTPPNEPTFFDFVGLEGVPWQMGVSPLGGYFAFDNNNPGRPLSYSIIIDTDENGTYGDNDDRVLVGTCEDGLNEVFWDGLDAAGNKVPGGASIKAQIKLNGGEVHFPFFDAEANPNGFKITRQIPAGGDVNTIYYDDRYNYVTGTAESDYDYSPCPDGIGAGYQNPPASVTVSSPLTSSCYGVPPTPASALGGIDSSVAGQGHTWDTHVVGSPQDGGFGNLRGINTWTYIPTPEFDLDGTINVKVADLTINKTVTTTPANPGDPIEYTIVVANNGGPSDIIMARVTDELPSKIKNVTWSCAVTNDAAGSVTNKCHETSGGGNTLDVFVDLNKDAEITFTINGTIVSGAPDAGTINIATVERPNDVTDPNLSNNTSTAITDPLAGDKLGAAKAFVSVVPVVANVYQVTYDIKLVNMGNNQLTNVQITEDLSTVFNTAGTTFEVKDVQKIVGANITTLVPPAYDGNGNNDMLAAGSFLNKGEIAIVRLVVNVTKPDTATPHVYNNNVTATADGGVTDTSQNGTNPDPDGDGDPTEATEQDPTRVVFGDMADLRLIKTVDNATPSQGDQVEFTIVLTNDGPDQATGVEVTDKLPTGLKYVSATPETGTTYDDGTGIWTVGTLAKNASVTLKIRAEVTASSAVENGAQVTKSDQFDRDSVPDNDIAIEDDQDSATVTPTPLAIGIAKGVASGSPVSLGGNQFRVTYEFVVENLSATTLSSVQVTEDLKTAFTDASSFSLHSITSSDFTVNTAFNGDSDTNMLAGSDTLATGTSGKITLVVDITPGNDTAKLPYQNTAQASGTHGSVTVNDISDDSNDADGADPDPNGNNNAGDTDEDTPTPVTFPLADLAVTHTVDKPYAEIGEVVKLTINLENQGTDTATNVKLEDVLPAGLEYVTDDSGGAYNSTTGIWDVGTINNSDTKTLVISVRVTGTTTQNSTAQVNASDQFDKDSTPDNDTEAEDDQQTVSVTPLAIGLAKRVSNLTRVDNTPTFDVEITFVVENLGAAALDNVQVTDNLETTFGTTGFSVQSVSSSDFTVNSPGYTGTTSGDTNLLAASGNTLAVGASGEIKLTLRVTPGANRGPYDNTAQTNGTHTGSSTTVSDTSDNGTDPDPNGNGNPKDTDEDDPTPISFKQVDLELTQDISTQVVQIGDEVEYTLTITNKGPDDATGVTVLDKLPPGLEYVSDTSGGSYDPDTGIWTVGNLAKDQTVTIKVRAKVTSDTPVKNTAEIETCTEFDVDSIPGDMVGTTPHSDQDDETVTTVTPISIGLEQKLTDKQPLGKNNFRLTYVFTVENLSDVTLDNIQVTENLKQAYLDDGAVSYTVVSVESNDGLSPNNDAGGSPLFNGDSVQNLLKGTDSLPAGEKRTITLVVDVTPGDPANWTYDTTAIARGSNSGVEATDISDDGSDADGSGTDPNGNGNANETGENTPTPVTFDQADLKIEQTVDNPNAQQGETVVFTIKLTNEGPTDASGVSVLDKLPDGITFVADNLPDGVYDETTGTWNVGNLKQGESVTLIITGTMNSTDPQINTAQVDTCDQFDKDSTPGNNVESEDDQASVTITPAAIGIAKRVASITPVDARTYDVTYTLLIENLVQIDIADIQVTDDLGTTFAQAQSFTVQQVRSSDFTVNWPGYNGVSSGDINLLQGTDTLKAGTSGTIDVVVRVVPGSFTGPYDNSATTSGTAQGKKISDISDNGSTSDPDGDGTTNEEGENDPTRVSFEQVDLEVTQTVDTSSTTVGSEVVLTIQITNRGPGTATGVTVRDKLPQGLTYISDDSGGSYDSDTGIWTVGELEQGKTVTIKIRVRVDEAGNYTTTAQVETADQIDVDSTPANNVESEDDQQSITITTPDSTPQLDVFKRDNLLVDANSDTVPSPGDTLRYEITIRNPSSMDVDNVVFNDTPDSNTTLMAGSVTSSQGSVTTGNTKGDSQVQVAIGTLAAGTEATVTFDVQIASVLPDEVRTIRNQGTVGGDSIPTVATDDPDTPTEDDPTDTPVRPFAQIQAFKRDSLLKDNDGNGMPSPGDTLHYEMTIMNTGNTDAALGVVVSDQPDPNTTLVAGSVKASKGTVLMGNAQGDRSVQVQVGTIAAGTSITIQFDAIIADPLPDGVVRVSNQGVVRSDNVPSVVTDDPDTPRTDDPTNTLLTTNPDLDTFKRDSLLFDQDRNGRPSAGDTLVYEVVLINRGNAAATNVVFSDVPDSNTTLEVGSVKTSQGSIVTGNATGDSTVKVQVGDIPAGSLVTISFQVTIASPLPANTTTIENQGTTTADNHPLSLTDDPDTSSIDDPTMTVVVNEPVLKATKRDNLLIDRDNNGYLSAGDVLNYSVMIENPSTATATGVVFTDTPDSNTTLEVGSVQTSQGSITRGNKAGESTIGVDIGTLPAGGSVTISYRVTVNNPLPDGVRKLINQGVVTSNELNTNGRKVRTDDPDTTSGGDETATLIGEENIAISIKKTVNLARIAPNQVVTYTIDVTNTSDLQTLWNVVITDTLDEGLTYVPGSAQPIQPASVQGQTMVWIDITGGAGLAPGQSFQMTYNASVTTTIGTYTNNATVIGEHPDGKVTDQDSIPFTVEDPVVEVHKGVATPGVTNGVITFTITITNTGPSTLDVVPLVDHFVGPIAYIGGTPAADMVDNRGQVIGWTDLTEHFGDMQPGQVFTLVTVFQLTVAEDVDMEIRNTATVTNAQDVYNNMVSERSSTSVTRTRDPGSPSLIDLLSLTATRRGDAVVDIAWTTGAEMDTHGFHIWRSSDGTFTNATRATKQLILARGTTTSGASYAWTDTTAGDSESVTYWLEEIETSGHSRLYGPAMWKRSSVQEQHMVLLPLVANR